MRLLLYVVWGALFGFLLHQARVTDYDAILNMFLLRDFHLMGVMGSAIAVAALGLAVLRRRARSSPSGEPTELRPKALHGGVIAGSLLFGIGWALSGACPGTALAQLWEGKLYALATIAGLFAGTLSYGAWKSREPA
ncbi:MAG: YeeE/YedE family protein [Planctomycetes bacterium]|nr:YeeE/YedE family protein [Planctomycetota bacterium]